MICGMPGHMRALDDHNGGGCNLLCHRGPTLGAVMLVAVVDQRLGPPF
jgi:hypothetical protein